MNFQLLYSKKSVPGLTVRLHRGNYFADILFHSQISKNIPDVLIELDLRFADSDGSNDPSVANQNTYLFCIDDLTDEAISSQYEELRSKYSGRLGHNTFIIWPEQAWTLLFGDDETIMGTAPSARMVSDAAIDDPKADTLKFGPYADAIFGLIDHPDTKTPLTLAINAKWGMGKTSLAKLVEHKLRNKPASWNVLQQRRENPHATYWFNAWMHDEADKLAAAFMADAVRECHRKLPLWRRLMRPLPDSVCGRSAQTQRRAMLIGFGILAVGWAVLQMLMGSGLTNGGTQTGLFVSFIGFLAEPESRVGGTLLLVATAVVANFAKLRETAQAIGAYVGAPARESNFGSLGRVRDELKTMIRRVTPEGSKFVVFIDDLERCRDTHAVDVLEVVNQLLSFDPVVTIVVADMPAVATCVEIKYKDLAARYDPEWVPTSSGTRNKQDGRRTYGRLFLQKFIQIQFNLPPAMPGDLANFSNLISAPDGDEEARPDQPRAVSRMEVVLLNIIRGIWRTAGAAWQTPKDRGNFLPPWMASSGPISATILVILFAPLLLTSWLQRIGLKLAQVPHLKTSGVWRYAVMLLTLAYQLMIMLVTFNGLADVYYSQSLFGPSSSDFYRAAYNISGVLQSAVLVLLAPGIWLLGWFERRKRENDREQARQAAARIDPHDEQSLAAYDERFSQMDEEDRAAILRETSQRALNDKSQWFEGARAEALRDTALPPRNIKRLINRLRLLLFILDAKQLLHDKDGLTPKKIGKWVAIQEVWPDLAAAIRHAPEMIDDAEKATDDEAWKTILDAHAPFYAADNSLREFISKPPNIGSVSRILTTFSIEPASTSIGEEVD